MLPLYLSLSLSLPHASQASQANQANQTDFASRLFVHYFISSSSGLF